jgi:SWI/SNF-related matrix-associated actin-dependent regulator of chromatin subfamily A member 5
MYKGNFDVCLTTYEAFRYVPEVISKFKWYYLVFDEAHKLKNSESENYKAAWKFKCQRRLLLTGTPLQNDLGELWSLLNLTMPKVFGNKDLWNEMFNFEGKKND